MGIEFYNPSIPRLFQGVGTPEDLVWLQGQPPGLQVLVDYYLLHPDRCPFSLSYTGPLFELGGWHASGGPTWLQRIWERSVYTQVWDGCAYCLRQPLIGPCEPIETEEQLRLNEQLAGWLERRTYWNRVPEDTRGSNVHLYREWILEAANAAKTLPLSRGYLRPYHRATWAKIVSSGLGRTYPKRPPSLRAWAEQITQEKRHLMRWASLEENNPMYIQRLLYTPEELLHD